MNIPGNVGCDADGEIDARHIKIDVLVGQVEFQFDQWELLEKAVEIYPENRFQTIQEMRQAHQAIKEVKAPGKEPRALQLHRHKQLRALGYLVFVLDAPQKIGGILDEIQTT